MDTQNIHHMADQVVSELASTIASNKHLLEHIPQNEMDVIARDITRTLYMPEDERRIAVSAIVKETFERARYYKETGGSYEEFKRSKYLAETGNGLSLPSFEQAKPEPPEKQTLLHRLLTWFSCGWMGLVVLVNLTAIVDCFRGVSLWVGWVRVQDMYIPLNLISYLENIALISPVLGALYWRGRIKQSGENERNTTRNSVGKAEIMRTEQTDSYGRLRRWPKA